MELSFRKKELEKIAANASGEFDEAAVAAAQSELDDALARELAIAAEKEAAL